MDQQRRSFLTVFSTAVPVAISMPYLFNHSGENIVENEKKELWDILANIKIFSMPERIKEMSKLNGQYAELRGFLNDTHTSILNERKHILSPKPISCCVECCIFGSEPFILVDTKTKISSYTKPVNIRGRLKIMNKSPLAYLYMDDAQII